MSDRGVIGLRGVAVGEPPVRRLPDRDPRVVPGDSVELGRVGRVDDDVPGTAPLDAVDQVGRPEGGGRRHDHRTELHHREHRLPELHLVAEHQDDAVAAGHPLAPEPAGHLVGAAHHVVEGVRRLTAVLLDDVQRGRGVVAGVAVEPVDRPVERPVEAGPVELGQRLLVVAAEREDLVSGGAVELGRGTGGHR
jgi:hypothetical protein